MLTAGLFAGGIHHFSGSEKALEFVTGYLIEKSLSLDNVFVFVLLFSAFAIPAKEQHRVLFWGILGGLVMRAVFVLAGAALLARFHFILYVFGGLLVLAGAGARGRRGALAALPEGVGHARRPARAVGTPTGGPLTPVSVRARRLW